MTVAILIVNNAAGLPCPERGHYVQSMDFEAMEGFGHLTVTKDIRKALHFAKVVEAMEFMHTVPKCHPKRPDGKPNRPMTAFTVGIIPVEEA